MTPISTFGIDTFRLKDHALLFFQSRSFQLFIAEGFGMKAMRSRVVLLLRKKAADGPFSDAASDPFITCEARFGRALGFRTALSAGSNGR